MAVEAFLNPVTESTVTGELTDEEIIGMINHAEDEVKGIDRATCGEVGAAVQQSEGLILLSTSEALEATRSLINKLLVDTNVPEVGLTAIGTLRELEKAWRIQKLGESTVQQSILSYFTFDGNLHL